VQQNHLQRKITGELYGDSQSILSYLPGDRCLLIEILRCAEFPELVINFP
jgi:hypothetical protein